VPVLVLDSGGVSCLAERNRQALAFIAALRDEGFWPPIVPSPVLVECLQGHAGRDAKENRFLKTCDVIESISETLARRAASLRRLARRGSAIDAIVVASAEPGGTVLTSDPHDLQALAAHADGVEIVRV
jgi:predicted nucleic acid-binding protein